MDYENPGNTLPKCSVSSAESGDLARGTSEDASASARIVTGENGDFLGPSCEAHRERKRSARTYFLYCSLLNRVKIGRAADVGQRVRELSTGSPARCVLVAVIDEDREAELHRRFAGDRRHREWFLVSRNLARFIHSLPVQSAIDLVRKDAEFRPFPVRLRDMPPEERDRELSRRVAIIKHHDQKRAPKAARLVERIRAARLKIRKKANLAPALSAKGGTHA